MLTVREITEENQEGWKKVTKEVEVKTIKWFTGNSDTRDARIEESTDGDEA